MAAFLPTSSQSLLPPGFPGKSSPMRLAVRLPAVALLLLTVLLPQLSAQTVLNQKYGQRDKFRQLNEILPTPNSYRTASGAPGHEYWQQKADYVIAVELNDTTQQLTGRETITYHNQSPDTLKYLWLQLDPNLKALNSGNRLTADPPSLGSGLSYQSLQRLLNNTTFDGGATITEVSAADGSPLKRTIVTTNMRIDLPQPLAPGQSFQFNVAWTYQIPDSRVSPGRTGCEFFEKDGNYLYEIAQWFPRMCAYNDVNGWQNKEYLGKGEFALEFGDYKVRITVPADHVVAATGELQNADQVLTATQQQRLQQARESAEPIFVITPEEAAQNQAEVAAGSKTWEFHATNVRDFAFASSRKFIWDAAGHDVGGQRV
ncbi:MAG: aminopeptidase, partial [Planctomycetaceae bacterium]